MRQSVPVSRILRETNVPLIRYRPAPRSSSPFNRNHRPPLPPASAAPEPPFEVENLGAGAQSDPQQRLRRKQRDVMAGGGIARLGITPAQRLPARPVEVEPIRHRECR